MPDKTHVDQLRRLLQEARQAVDTLASAMGAIEEELAALEQEVEERAEYYSEPGDQTEVPQLTTEELGIASVKMLLTFQEAAGLLSVPVAAVGDMVDRGEIPVCNIGWKARIPRSQLWEYINKHGRSSPAEGEGKGAGVQHPK